MARRDMEKAWQRQQAAPPADAGARLDRIRTATARLADAQAARDDAILRAHAAGEPVRTIAAAAGVTTQRVYQLIAAK